MVNIVMCVALRTLGTVLNTIKSDAVGHNMSVFSVNVLNETDLTSY